MAVSFSLVCGRSVCVASSQARYSRTHSDAFFPERGARKNPLPEKASPNKNQVLTSIRPFFWITTGHIFIVSQQL